MMIIFQIALAELKRIFQNKSVISVIIFAPFFYILFYPQPFLNEVSRNIPIIAIDHDRTIASNDFLRRLNAHQNTLIVEIAPDLDSAKSALFKRNAFGIIQIPLHFERNLVAGKSSPVIAFNDASFLLIYKQIATAISNVATTMSQETALKQLLSRNINISTAQTTVAPFIATLIPLFNPQSGYATYLLPASFNLILQQTLLMGICILGLSNIRNSREQQLKKNTSHRMINTLYATFGKLIAYIFLYTFLFYIYNILVPYWYEIPRIGHFTDLFWLGIPYLLSISLLGMTLSNLMSKNEHVYLALTPIGLCLFFLSGTSWPHELTPGFIRYFANIFPSTAGIDAMVRINQMGATLQNVSKELNILWSLVAIYASSTIYMNYRKYEQD